MDLSGFLLKPGFPGGHTQGQGLIKNKACRSQTWSRRELCIITCIMNLLLQCWWCDPESCYTYRASAITLSHTSCPLVLWKLYICLGLQRTLDISQKWEHYKETYLTAEIRLCPTLSYYILYACVIFRLYTVLGNCTSQGTFWFHFKGRDQDDSSSWVEPKTIPSVQHPPAQTDRWLILGGPHKFME